MTGLSLLGHAHSFVCDWFRDRHVTQFWPMTLEDLETFWGFCERFSSLVKKKKKRKQASCLGRTPACCLPAVDGSLLRTWCLERWQQSHDYEGKVRSKELLNCRSSVNLQWLLGGRQRAGWWVDLILAKCCALSKVLSTSCFSSGMKTYTSLRVNLLVGLGEKDKNLNRIWRKCMTHWMERKINASSCTPRIVRIWNVRMSHNWSCFVNEKAIPLCIIHMVHDYFMEVDGNSLLPFSRMVSEWEKKTIK